MTDHIEIVALELLELVGREAPTQSADTKSTSSANGAKHSNGRPQSRLRVNDWLTERGRGFDQKPEPDGKGRTVYVLDVCPFNEDHRAPDACVMQDTDGKMSAHCFHNSCNTKGWQDFKDAIGAPDSDHYDPPLRNPNTSKQGAGDSAPATASCDIPLPDGKSLNLVLTAVRGRRTRLVLATRDETAHRDVFDPDSSTARLKFLKALAKKLKLEHEALAALVEEPLAKLSDEIQRQCNSQPGSDLEDKNQATLAFELTVDWDLWHSPSNVAYATVPVGNHLETWPVRSKRIRQLLQKLYFAAHERAMNSESASAAVNLIEARAVFDGAEHPVFTRVGETDGKIYVDLCNKDWQVVEITADGWRVIDESPVRFRRSDSMQPLPVPERGGSVELLRLFINVDDTCFVLIVGWLVMAFHPRGSYPVLALFAEHGSGKSTAAGFFKDLVDPNSSALRGDPKDLRDFMIAANNTWCTAFDNLSHLPQWLSDALCRLSTGGGFSTRELYSDLDEVTLDLKRPSILASIEEIATRPDLLDRCLMIILLRIDENQRRSETDMKAEFEKIRPLILGALFDGVSAAIRNRPTTKLSSMPRMTELVLWVTAAESAFGWPAGTFMRAYRHNCESANEVALEASVIARPLLDLLEANGGWDGSAAELLTALELRHADLARKAPGWPKTPRSLAGHLKRIAPNLRSAGWTVEYGRTGNKRSWSIHCAEQAPPASNDGCGHPNDGGPQPGPSPDGSCESMQGDADLFGIGGDDGSDANDANSGEPWNPDRY